MQNQCAEIKIRAERKAGELIPEKVSAGNPQLSHDETIRLDDLGINRMQSHRWQTIANILKEVREIAQELWIAREMLLVGHRPKSGDLSSLNTWNKYCEDIGS